MYKKSNKGGWHSQNFKLKKRFYSIQICIRIQKYIGNAFQNLDGKLKIKIFELQEMWAIINKKNNFNLPHIHPNCYLSAAYYVKAIKNCGKFQVESLILQKDIHILKLKIKMNLIQI